MKEKLFAAKAELRIRQRQLNAAQRGYTKVLKRIEVLNGRTGKLAAVEPTLEHLRRGEGQAVAGTRVEEPLQGDVLATPASEVQRHAGVEGED
jgi:hypothetical protein